jgi:hypothetical protein
MYRLQYSSVAVLLCLLVSCSSTKEEGIINIMELPTYSVEGVKHNKEEIVSGNSWEFHRIGDNFLIFNGRPTSAALVVRMSDCKELGEFSLKGVGPGESNTPRYAGCSVGEDTIYMYDTFKFGMSVYSLPIQQTDTLDYSFVYSMRSSQDELHGPTYRLENGLTVSSRLSGTRNLFSLLDERMDTICTFGGLPVPISDDHLKSLMPFQGIITVEKNTVYYACKFLPYMCAYEIGDKDKITLKFQHNYEPPVFNYSPGSIRMDIYKTRNAFRDIKIHKGYIWTSYHGGIEADILKDPYGLGFAQSMVLFNMKGEPLVRFNMPIKGGNFCFSKDGDILYLITPEADIYAFKVDDFLKRLD